MAEIPAAIFQDWSNGDTIHAEEYEQEREIMRVAINDNNANILANVAGLALKQALAEKGQASGYAGLDAGAKLLLENFPDAVLGQVQYQGTWNATTDTPTLPDATTVKGHYYIVATAGTYGAVVYGIGDWAISNGVEWQKVDNTDAVSSVFGRTGAILAATNDYTWAQIDKTLSSLADIAIRSAGDLNSGFLPMDRIQTGVINASKLDPAIMEDVELGIHRTADILDHPDGSVTDAKLDDDPTAIKARVGDLAEDVESHIEDTYTEGAHGLDNTMAKFKAGSSSYTDNDTSQTFADAFCTAGSLVEISITSATEPQGVWSVESAAGTFTITSTEPETDDITFDYYIIKAGA